MFDIWLYSDETQTNEIRLNDPTRLFTSVAQTIAAGAGIATGASVAHGAGGRTIEARGVAVGTSSASTRPLARRRAAYGISFNPEEPPRRYKETMVRRHG